MLGIGVGIGVHGDGVHTQAAGGGGHAAGDLAAIGDQNFCKHLSHLGRSRKERGQAPDHGAQKLEQHHQQQHRNDHHHQQAMPNATGCFVASHTTATTRPSSSKRQARCWKRFGRGVDGSARGGLGRPATWQPVAPQQTRNHGHGARCRRRTRPQPAAAPAGTRITVLTHVPERCPVQGILSAKNSTNSMKPLTASTSGCCNTCSPAGSGSQPPAPDHAHQKHHRVQAESRWPSPRRRPAPAGWACRAFAVTSAMPPAHVARGACIHVQTHGVQPLQRCAARAVSMVRCLTRSRIRPTTRPACASCRKDCTPSLALVAGADVGNALHRGGDQRRVDLALGHVLHQLFAGAHGVGAGAGQRLEQLVHLGVQLARRPPPRAQSRCGCASAALKRSAVRK